MLLDNDLYIQQIQFINNVIKISDMFLSGAKKKNGENLFLDHSHLNFIIPENKDKIEKLIKNTVKKNYKITLDLYDQNDYKSNNYLYSQLKEVFMFSHENFSK